MEIPGPTVQGIERTNEANQLFAAIDILQRGPVEPSRQDPRISWGRGQQRWNLVEREHPTKPGSDFLRRTNEASDLIRRLEERTFDFEGQIEDLLECVQTSTLPKDESW